MNRRFRFHSDDPDNPRAPVPATTGVGPSPARAAVLSDTIQTSICLAPAATERVYITFQIDGNTRAVADWSLETRASHG